MKSTKNFFTSGYYDKSGLTLEDTECTDVDEASVLPRCQTEVNEVAHALDAGLICRDGDIEVDSPS